MIRYDPILVELTSNFFVLSTSVNVYLYIYSKNTELSMDIYEGKCYVRQREILQLKNAAK